MIIHCIVVYTSISKKQEFHAAVNCGWFATEPHLDKILNNISTVSLILNGRDGGHTLATHDQIYYAYKKGDWVSFVATDEALSPMRLQALFEKISQVKNAVDLEKLISDPEEAVKTKVDLIEVKIEETKEMMLENIEKVIARRDNLAQLMARTEDLTAASFIFSKRSNDLKNKARCPGLFSFFNSVRSMFTDDEYNYDYEPASLSKS